MSKINAIIIFITIFVSIFQSKLFARNYYIITLQFANSLFADEDDILLLINSNFSCKFMWEMYL